MTAFSRFVFSSFVFSSFVFYVSCFTFHDFKEV